MERIATSFCSFEVLRKRYTYVDKTDMLWRLVSDAEDRMFFISRPRRFGKSLMLDTLKCIFEGKRELFKGLKIEKRKYDWKAYPVVMLDMSKVTASSVDELHTGLIDTVDGLVKAFRLKGVSRQPNPGRYLGNFFGALAAAQGEFVVLVDEYDVPLQGFLNDRSAIRRVRKLMHDFYVQLKNNSGSIRFMMMTGVTKLHFRLFMEMLGAKVRAEEGSARGYADAIIETRDFVWVFEFKFNRSARAAVRQIREKGYADAYRSDRRPVTPVGVSFRAAKRNIDEPLLSAF